MTIGDDKTMAQPAADGPARIAHYRVLRELGRGGMGVVLLARDERLERSVALKLISSPAANEQERLRFLREAQSAARLNHPHIATIYDVGEHEGKPYLAMEYVEGESLAAVLRAGPLALERARALAEQLASALRAAHGAGVVHRDLKPGNVVLMPSGDVKLLDFGLARPVTDEETPRTSGPLTETGMIVGTPAYMSPEQARGGRAEPASDVFSFGTLLYEALTGVCPFHRPTVLDALNAVVGHQPPPASQLRPEIPAPLADVVERCLDKAPERRPASAELPGLLAGTSLLTPLSPPPPAPGVEVAAGRVAVLPFKNTAGASDHDWIGAGITDTLAHELRRSESLTVIAQAEVQGALAGSGAVPEMGRRLGAEWIVRGSFQVAGPRLRIVCSAVHLPEGDETSCDRVDGPLDDIFELQDRVVDAVRAVLHTQRVAPSSTGEALLHPDAREAYELYARGLVALQSVDGARLDEAEGCFRAATERDPDYGLAWSGIGAIQLMRFITDGSSPVSKAIYSLQRAIDCDNRIPEAHVWMAHAQTFLHDFDRGARHARRALELDPEQVYGWMFAGINEWMAVAVLGPGPERLREAVSYLERAILLSPRMGSAIHNVGMVTLYAGGLDRAEERFARALKLERSGVGAPWIGATAYLGVTALWRGDLDRAGPLLRAGLAELEGDTHVLALPMATSVRIALAEYERRSGDAAAARAQYENTAQRAEAELVRPGMVHHVIRAELGLAALAHVDGDHARRDRLLRGAETRLAQPDAAESASYDSFIAHSYFALAAVKSLTGAVDEAIRALDGAYRHGLACAERLDSEPDFDPIRTTPEFLAERTRAADFRLAPSLLLPSAS